MRRLQAFQEYIQSQQKDLENCTFSDIQQYIRYLKKEKALSAGTINNYISAILFYTHILDKEWNKKKIPRMKRVYNGLGFCSGKAANNRFIFSEYIRITPAKHS